MSSDQDGRCWDEHGDHRSGRRCKYDSHLKLRSMVPGAHLNWKELKVLRAWIGTHTQTEFFSRAQSMAGALSANDLRQILSCSVI